MAVLKGWYSQDGWSTKLLFINKVDEENEIKMRFYDGETDKVIKEIKLALKPHEIKSILLDDVEGLSGCKGVVKVYSKKKVHCEGLLTEKDKPNSYLYYRLPEVPEVGLV